MNEHPGSPAPRPARRGPASLAWQDEALCREVGVELFYPEDDGEYYRTLLDTAKAICGECEVRLPCLAYARDRDERHGIWGGMTPLQRRRLARAPPTPASSDQQTDDEQEVGPGALAEGR